MKGQLLIAILVTSALLGVIPAFANDYVVVKNDTNTSICTTLSCGYMTQDERNTLINGIDSYNNVNTHASTSFNYLFAIIKTPAGPELNNVILNKTDLVKLQNNVGIFTACGSINNGLCTPAIVTTSSTNANYCQIAKFIHVNEDGYDNFPVGASTIFVATTPPPECDNVPAIPEFGPISVLVLAIATISIVIFTAKYRTIKF